MQNLKTDVTLPRMKQPGLPPSIFLTICPTQDYLGMSYLITRNSLYYSVFHVCYIKMFKTNKKSLCMHGNTTETQSKACQAYRQWQHPESKATQTNQKCMICRDFSKTSLVSHITLDVCDQKVTTQRKSLILKTPVYVWASAQKARNVA